MSVSGEEATEPGPSGVGAPRQDSASKLFLGGLSWDTTEEKLGEHFEKFGELIEVVVMRDRMTGRPRGFGFVTFKYPESAQKAVKEVHVVDGRQASMIANTSLIDVKRSVPLEGKPKACKVFVGGLAPETTEHDFMEYFGQYGQISEVQIMFDHMSGRSRGFGFVTFEEDSSAEKVFGTGTMHELGGKQVEVKAATPKGSGPSQPTQQQQQQRQQHQQQQQRQQRGGGGGAGFDPTAMMRGPYGSPMHSGIGVGSSGGGGGGAGAAVYPPYPMYGYNTRPGMMSPYGSTMQYPGMPPQYHMMPSPSGMVPGYVSSGPTVYSGYQTAYSGPGRGGAPGGGGGGGGGGLPPSSSMPFTPPSPQSLLQHHGLYSATPSSPSPPYRQSTSGGGLQRGKNGSARNKVDSASSLDAQHAERQLKKLSLE